jgi:hypothetical protein
MSLLLATLSSRFDAWHIRPKVLADHRHFGVDFA